MGSKPKPQKESDMRNEYGELVERWKVDVILDMARKRGFRPDELDDVQQEIVPAVLAFRFDSQKSNGATERTAVTALVNRRLTFIQRGRARQLKHHERYMELIGLKNDKPFDEIAEDVHPDAVAMAFDVREAVAGLPAQEQAVCAALSRGDNRVSIARAMGLTRSAVECLIRHIRDQFHAGGLDAWVVRA